MNKHPKELADLLSNQQMKSNQFGADSMLDFLYSSYTEEHPIDNEVIRHCYEKMEPLFDSLPQTYANQLFRNIADLCNEYGQTAFKEGVRIGAAMEREIHSEK